MNIEVINVDNANIAVIVSEDIIINNAQDALDLV